MPEDLAPQLDTIRSLLPLAGVPVYLMQGIEADDIMATLAANAGEPVVIVTKDKDLFQLINDNIKIYDDYTGNLLGSAETEIKYGVRPEQMRDYLSLLGDKSDNIPGVAGVGEKTAAKLIQEYNTLDNIYAHIGEIKGKVREYLESDKANAYLARDLIKLEIINPLFEPILSKDDAKLRSELERLGMRTVLTKLQSVVEGVFLLENAKSGVDFGRDGGKSAGGVGISYMPCVMGDVNKPSFFLAVDGGFWVTDGRLFDLYRPEKHFIQPDSIFYDVKAFSKLTGKKYQRVNDYFLISWLCEPDTGVIYKARSEQIDEFITRFLNAVPLLDKKLKELGLVDLYTELEIPVAFVLGGMEKLGVRVDPANVRNVSAFLKQQITSVASRLISCAGYNMNLNSPKQLAEYLYDKLGIVPVSKNNRSTAEDVLQELMSKSPVHKEVIDDILTYREYSKLLSTYTRPLVEAITADGRVHTTFKQTGTATGRLSSITPNLQNIPARGEIGKAIRAAFVPADGYCFVSMDYSQIELRILAHLSRDPNLTDAFCIGEDIHTVTAMKIFNIKKEEVTTDVRRLAKAVNFGIIYGLSPFGLSRDVGITAKEAKNFIDAYFALYKNVRTYISNIIENTRNKGYCETILGRKRFFPDINSRNSFNRQRAERAAMNAPLQGSAADIIKTAMIRCDNLIEKNGLDVRLCLQIHDELIFEASLDVVEEFMPLARLEMENAIALNVPLVVNVSSGTDWGELK